MRTLNWLGLILGFVCLANLVWLGTSTLRIHNDSQETISDVAYTACDVRHEVGDLAPKESVFRFLDACGDDTLKVHVRDAEFCQTYIEGELYHVDARVVSANRILCSYDDLFSTLLIMKILF